MEAGPRPFHLLPSLSLRVTRTRSVSPLRLPSVLLCRSVHGPAGLTERTAPSARLVCAPSRPRRHVLTAAPSLPPVPFREAPAYTNRRRRAPSTLAAPRVLLRSNSDNNLHANAPDWAAGAASHRSLSPQLLQPAPGQADGGPRTVGSYVPGPRSRSPSLNRLGGASEDGKRPLQPWHAG